METTVASAESDLKPYCTIRLDAVSYRYRRGDKPVFAGLSLEVDRRPTVIVGPNGAGKSTMLRLLAGQLAPRRGTVFRAQPVGYSPQRAVLLPAFTLHEQVQYAGWLGGLPRRACAKRATTALEAVDLAPLADRKAPGLSGGEAARLGIACALVTEPEVVLLDEPTAALDPIARRCVTSVLRKLAAGGVTIVATSHTATDVGPPFKRLLMMDRGRVVFDGAPERFLEGDHADSTAHALAQALRDG